MTTEAMKKWIDEASYTELLREWRYARIGDLFFQGEMGKYYKKVLSQKRNEVGADEHTRTSKAIDRESWEGDTDEKA